MEGYTIGLAVGLGAGIAIGIAMTGGSDCHQKPLLMGTLDIPDWVAEQFSGGNMKFLRTNK